MVHHFWISASQRYTLANYLKTFCFNVEHISHFSPFSPDMLTDQTNNWISICLRVVDSKSCPVFKIKTGKEIKHVLKLTLRSIDTIVRLLKWSLVAAPINLQHYFYKYFQMIISTTFQGNHNVPTLESHIARPLLMWSLGWWPLAYDTL